MQDRVSATRERVAAHAEAIRSLQQEQQRMAALPEQVARIEERLDNLGRMVFAALSGIGALLLRELWNAVRLLRRGSA